MSVSTQICETCQSTNGLIFGDDGIARRCECGFYERRKAGALLAVANIPRRYRNKDFSTFTYERGDRARQQILGAAKAYCAAFDSEMDQGLLLRGQPGCGKTHIAVAILKEIVGRGFSGYYANFTDLLSRLRDTMTQGNSDETEARIMSRIDDCEILVLDDVGAENMTAWVRDRLYLIVNRRYEGARATIITTNCDEAELSAHVGERTASRLYEMCDHHFPHFPQEDFRIANLS